MEMPRRAGKHGRFLANSNNSPCGEYREIVCRVIPILDRLFSKHAKLALHQVILVFSYYLDLIFNYGQTLGAGGRVQVLD